MDVVAVLVLRTTRRRLSLLQIFGDNIVRGWDGANEADESRGSE